MEAAGPAYVTASENAKRNNAMYGRIFTSTPGDLDSRSGQQALEIVENTYRWTEKLYDIAMEKGIDEVRNIINTNCANGIVYIEYQYQQLGKDEEWFKKVCRVLNNNPLKIKREIFLKRIHGSTLSPYNAEDLEAINDKMGTIIEEIMINGLFKLDIYTTLNKNKIYFVGVDVANGYGSDNSAVTVWDPYTLKTVAEFKSAHIGVKQLIKFLFVLIKKYLPRSILIIERNANGEAVLDHLRDTPIASNLYFDNSKDLVGSDIDEKLDVHGMLRREASRRKLYGVYTQGKSRETMFSLLEAHINEYKEGFVGKNIINDIMKLVRKNNKIQADAGAHDDSIMSFLMCLYVYYHGNNLYRYGFVRGGLPTEEERNKGMNYGEILDLMSEEDRSFFDGAGFSHYEEDLQNFNIREQIANRGLIDKFELENEVKQNKQNESNFNPLSRMSPYERQVYEELRQATKESRAFDKAHNLTSNYEMISDDIEEDYVDLSIFDYLNE